MRSEKESILPRAREIASAVPCVSGAWRRAQMLERSERARGLTGGRETRSGGGGDLLTGISSLDLSVVGSPWRE